ncbi:hypothetical protein G7067_06845 [Leucobacter insecticola]|uniref:Uncharacterized protein n=1 Tax=Leucobacter insecticola TaxID=2714934 RepID=A0A6G8FJG1_9MICO|nr:hypothetical protein [Leucobacter insecticola]QIM16202.1 hypothetical protein G7067_06845 [Leucobacter insecticola]
MRLLYFDEDVNNYEHLEKVFSTADVSPQEVVVVARGDELQTLTSIIGQALGLLQGDDFTERVKMTPDQARSLQRAIAEILDATYTPA